MAEITIITLCLMLNALLSATETAFVSIGRPELRVMANAGYPGASRLLALRERPERTLSVVQLGITMVGLISGAVGGAGASETLRPLFEREWGLSNAWADFIAITIVVAPLTYLTVVVGEIAPKAMALRRPHKIGLRGAFWLTTLDRLLSPAVTSLEWSTKVVMRLFGAARDAGKTDAERDEEQLSDAHERYILNLVNIEAKSVGDIALPWKSVTFVTMSQSAEEVMSVVVKSGHTRLPVCEANGSVTGLLHTKEFMAFRLAGEHQWHSLVRSVLSARRGDPLLKVLRAMQERRSHLAMVYRLDGSPLGVVTLEDIIEEVFGDVFDEDDDQMLGRLLTRGRSRSARGGRLL
ncbi:MAG: hemolysin [Acidobacteria bacterium]|jgi:putative hemolysin|nr:hemolysin [Acidobacteriota bacterium]MBF84992.1 hemolysin [Acidobacteriota bacterium]MCH2278222.1 hemolysin family protein [Vicinamibacterales bacterium]MEC7767697.1 hemolysin family protein [Acidobacteriota bacterium]|tara:strand:+ start:5912 stop:6964 length:1053 start_codon:yes stop_codon:yes gene_type:complete